MPPRANESGGGRSAEARVTRRAALVCAGGPLRFYATCVCLAQVALTTPLAFEQPGKPLLDVDLPLPFAGSGGYDRRPPMLMGSAADVDTSAADDGESFSDRGIAVLFDDEVELPPPRLRLTGDRAGSGLGGGYGGYGGHVDYYHQLQQQQQQQHRNLPQQALPIGSESGDAEGGAGAGEAVVVRTISPPSIEMKGDGRSAQNRSYPLKSYVERETSKHQRVLFVKSKVRDLLKRNSTTSKSMQPAPAGAPSGAAAPAASAAAAGVAAQLLLGDAADRPGTSGGGPSGAAFGAAAVVPAAATAGGVIGAGGAQNAALEATVAAHGASLGQQPANSQQPQHQHLPQALVVERMAIAPPCVHEQTGANPADSRSAHVSVPVAPASGAGPVTASAATAQRTVVTASLHLFFHAARPTENKTGHAEEKLTVLLQQTVPCSRTTVAPGVRRFRRVVGHMRVPESFVGYVRFNLNRVLSSCAEGGAKNRWLIVSVLNSTGHLINAREFFGAGPCSAEGDATAAAAASSAALPDDSSWRTADEVQFPKPEDLKNWKPADRTGGSDSSGAQPKNYVEMTVALRRP